MKPSALALPGLIAATLVSIAGCSPGGQASLKAPCPKGRICLELGNTAEPLTLDPQKSSATWESRIIEELIIGLTRFSPDGRAIPGMATRWETSSDGLTWTFHLRDAQWSDGAPVTADDFVFGLRRMMDPKTAAAQASQIYAIKNAEPVNAGRMPVTALGVSAPDPKTVVIELEHPWPVLPDYANGAVMFPAPRHAVEKWGDGWVKPGRYPSNGPYTLSSWALGDRVILNKNPRYYDADKVCVDRLSFYPTTDSVSAERRVRRGELDANNNISSNRLAYLRRPDQMPAYVRAHPYVAVTFLIFNVRDVPALKDRNVRQALSMAIDREFITRKLLRGGQTPAYAFVPPGMVDYDGPERVYWAGWSLERRQAEARRLLALAGYGPARRLKLEIRYRSGVDTMLFLPSVQADLAEVGVNVTLSGYETQIAYASYNAKDFQVGDAGWAEAADAMGYLYLFRQDTGAQNWPGYRNPAYDAWLNAANGQKDLKVRASLLAKAERVLLEDMPIAPLYYPANRNLVSPEITGWVDNALDKHPASFLCVRDPAARRAKGQ